MKIILVSFLIIAILANWALASIAVQPNAVHKDHPGKCYIASTTPPTIMNPGDTVTISGCQRAVCDRKFNVEIHGCAAIPEKKGCTKADTPANRPYPECCPRVKCSK